MHFTNHERPNNINQKFNVLVGVYSCELLDIVIRIGINIWVLMPNYIILEGGFYLRCNGMLALCDKHNGFGANGASS